MLLYHIKLLSRATLVKQTLEEKPQQQQKQFWLLSRQLGLAQSQFFGKNCLLLQPNDK